MTLKKLTVSDKISYKTNAKNDSSRATNGVPEEAPLFLHRLFAASSWMPPPPSKDFLLITKTEPTTPKRERERRDTI